MFTQLTQQAQALTLELVELAGLEEGDLFVVGCSSSEVVGQKIGTGSSLEAAQAVFAGIYPVLKERGIFLAAQCCEHLNRSVVVEKQAMKAYGLNQVSVVPQPKAGGSFATTAYGAFAQPVLVQGVQAMAGLDIGGTLIGMQLRPVAVPVRLAQKQLGEALVLAARTRPPMVGGERAIYDEKLK